VDENRERLTMDPALLRGLTQRRISRRDALKYGGMGTLAAFLAACGVSGTQTPQRTPAGADLNRIYGKGKTGVLDFANWEDYIDLNSKGDSPTLNRFENETGIKVNYKTVITDNNPFLARIIPSLQAGQPSGYDLIVITNGGPIERMIKLGFLTPLDHRLLPNFARYAGPGVKNPDYDPGNKYTVAWQSGFTGIGYNSKVVKTPPRTFKDLLNPAYKGKVGMFSNNQDLPCPALVDMGFDVQNSTPEQWRQAAQVLQRQRDDGIVRKYYDQSYIDALKNGDTVITQAWSGDIFIESAPKDFGGGGYSELKFALPQEGGILWTDNMAIPLHAEHPVDAITFMNFVYDPQVAAQLADFIWYVSPVPAAREVVLNELQDPPVANSPLIFPSLEDQQKAHKYKVFKDAAEEEEWNSVFQPIFTA
jgi:spermidine/putrescine transport system substrate-binding protein